MEQLTRLVTGTKAFESLWKQFSADRFAHAYLITGNDPEYLKEFLLYAGAMALCPKGGCFSCVVCNKVFAGEHVGESVHLRGRGGGGVLYAAFVFLCGVDGL